LHVPDAGTLPSLRRLLDQLDDARVAVEDLSIHTPNLDDVFFAFTGESVAESSNEPVVAQ
jgi:ABC-2 type transport system ATP-binding protein